MRAAAPARHGRGQESGRAAADVVVALGGEDLGLGGAAEGPQLQVDVRLLGVHGGSDLFPLRNLCSGVDARDVVVAGGAGGDEGRFGDEEGAGDGGALRVVLDGHGEGDVGVVGAVAGQGGHHEAVLELAFADTQRI